MTPADETAHLRAAPDPGRFAAAAGAQTMLAVVTTGQGDYDRLEYRRVPLPLPAAGEVLLQVLAAGVNATDINTRVGWYGGGWDAPTPFPLIQGADCCGRVVAVHAGVDAGLLGRRALVRPCMRPRGFDSLDTVWLGSDRDGAFAQFVAAPASEVFPIESALSDAELGAAPCAWGTAENMLRRARVTAGERVLVTGASGGVGAAAVQLARRRGAHVTAVAGAEKLDRVRALGAETVLGRDDGVVAAFGERSFDVVVDNVSGPGLDDVLRALRRGGRYATSGAIAGADVALDKRVVYLHDLTLLGCTAWDEEVFPDLVGYLARGEVRPPVAATFPLEGIAEAQAAFLEHRHVGKIVLVPPPTG